MRSKLALAVWLSGLFSVAASGAESAIPDARAAGFSPERLAAVRKLLEDEVAARRIPGAVALLAHDGKVGYLDAVGWQSIEDQAPLRPDAIFRICSMTKPITSLAVMLLLEEGKLALDDPVAKFLPEFKETPVAVDAGQGAGKDRWQVRPAARPITIRHLLTHTSGLTYTFMGGEHFGPLYREAGISDGLIETKGTAVDNARKIAKVPLTFQPGESWQYSLATDVLGAVVEVVSQKSLDAFFRERIFTPLKMRDTHFRLPPEKRARLAQVYRPRKEGGLERLPEGRIDTGPVYSTSYSTGGPDRFFSGGAGLSSTATDYARFLQLLLNGGELDGVRLLKKETVDLMTSDQLGGKKLLFESHGDAFGFGFGVVTEKARDRGLGSVGTFSWGGFYFTYFFADPKKKLAAVLLTQMQPWGSPDLWTSFRKRAYEALGD